MLNQQPGHLTFDALASLIGAGRVASEEVRTHISQCSECGSILNALRSVADAAGASAQPPAEPVPCLSFFQIGQLASGIAGPEGRVWMSHVLTCDRCGSELLEAIQTFHGELTPEEEARVQTISQPAPVVTPPAKPPAKVWIGALAACLILALAVGAFWYVRARNAPERLLAQAYTRQRLIDYRLADAGYARVARARGERRLPPELLRAEAELGARLESNARDARTFRLEGLAELQASHPESAVDALERARKLNPQDAQTLADLGAAYAQRGETDRRADDFTAALEFLNQAMNADPALLRARFNRALVLERLNLLEDAVAAWDAYLAHDASGPWAAEARERQAAVRARLKPRAIQREMLRRGPDVLLDPAARQISPDLFLDSAVFGWLAAKPSAPEFRAIQALAEDLAARHGDVWLRQSLREVPAGSPLWSQMGAVADANVKGNTEALRLAGEVREAALAAHAPTFAGRADFEAIYALDRIQKWQQCLDRSADFLARESSAPLSWLNVSVRSEEANCLVLSGQEGKAVAVLAGAVKLAEAAKIEGPGMRARTLLVGVNTNAGDPWSTFAAAPELLTAYWNSGFPANRLHQLSFNLGTAAQFLGYPNAACSFAEAATRAISQTDNHRTEALTRARLSTIALAAGQTDLAKAQADLAFRFFSHDADPAAAAYRDDAALTAAEADLATRNFASLNQRLNPLASSPSPLPTFLLDLRLRRLEASAALHDSNWKTADDALDRALNEVRSRLAGMPGIKQRVALFRQAAPLFRMRVEEFLDRGEPDRALQPAVELFSLADSGASASLRPEPRETWLIYVSLPTRVASWKITSSGFSFRWIPGTRAELASRIEDFGYLVSNPAADARALRAASSALFSDLVGGSADTFHEGDRLVIVPDGELAALPFPALNGPGGSPLGLQVKLVRTHNLSNRRMAAGLGPSGLMPLAGAAVRRPGLDLPPLPEVDLEGQYVASGQPVETLSGDNLTVANLAARAPFTDWLHFAGHGYVNAGNGALFPSGSERSLLTAAQILRMDWSRCHLAVLSACWAAAGESRGFVNPESLVQAFLSAGVRGVVAPAWTIDSAAAALWMRQFYAAMRQGTDPPGAILAASRYLAGQPRFQSPYYWASFEYFT